MNLSKFSLLLLLSVLVVCSSCRSQSKTDVILSKKAGDITTEDISALSKSGYIRNIEAPLLGTLMMSIAQTNDTQNWTVKQLMDSVNVRLKQVDDAITIKNNFGKDSVFVRFPNGNKMFIGMGELSIEKLIERASVDLPNNYDGSYNLKINSEENINKVSQFIANSEYPVLVGNVLLYKRDKGQLPNTKIGDIIEISKRIANCKEFTPFLDMIK